MKKRSRSRELALQSLYQVDLCGREKLAEIPAFMRGEEREKATLAFALQLVEGTVLHWDALNRVIASVAQNWDIARMAVIDRNVLRLATFELLYCKETPPKVAINEAIELGKRYSTQNSGGFINGILDRIKERYVDGGEPLPGEEPAAAPSDPEAPERAKV